MACFNDTFKIPSHRMHFQMLAKTPTQGLHSVVGSCTTLHTHKVFSPCVHLDPRDKQGSGIDRYEVTQLLAKGLTITQRTKTSAP